MSGNAEIERDDFTSSRTSQICAHLAHCLLKPYVRLKTLRAERLNEPCESDFAFFGGENLAHYRQWLHLTQAESSATTLASSFSMVFRRAAGTLAVRLARSSRSLNTVSKSVAAAVEAPACSAAKPQVHLSRCFSAAAEPAPAPSAVKGYVTQVLFLSGVLI